jgi:hypothetical protein
MMVGRLVEQLVVEMVEMRAVKLAVWLVSITVA